MTTDTTDTTIIDLPALGRLEFDEDGDATTTLPLGPAQIPVEVRYRSGELDPALLERAGRAASDLAALDRHARNIIREHLALDEGAVHEFGSAQLQKVERDLLLQHFGVTTIEDVDHDRFVKGLQLADVTLWVFTADPDEDEPESADIACRYVLGDHLTPDSVCIDMRILGKPREVEVSVDLEAQPAPPHEWMNASLEHETLGRLDFDADGMAISTRMLGEAPVAFGVSFDAGATKEMLDRSAPIVADLVAFDALARGVLAHALETGEPLDAAPLYKSHHLEEVEEAKLLAKFGVGDLSQIDNRMFLAGMLLTRVGVYINPPDRSIECDYTIGEDLTQYVLCLRFDGEGELQGIALES